MIKKIIIYFLIFLFFLYLYRELLYAGIRKNKQGVFYKYNELFLNQGCSYDLLFLGSSRAEMHFNPKIIDEKTSLNCFNMGISGASLRISNALLKAYLENHKTPNYIVLNIDYFWLDTDHDILNNFPRYFPYLSNSTLRKELNKIDDRFNSFYMNPIFSLPFTQAAYFSASLHGWLKISGKYDTLGFKGFQTSLIQDIDTTIKYPKPIFSSISKKNKKDLENLIEFIQSKNIKLILVTSPIFGNGNYQTKNKQNLVYQIKQITTTNQIPYFNFTDSSSYSDINLYSDYLHLNLYGANKFSSSVSNIINNLLLKQNQKK